jgi:hypothetical protein
MNITSKDLITYQMVLQDKEVERLASSRSLERIKKQISKADFSYHDRIFEALMDIGDFDESTKAIQDIIDERKKFIENLIKKPLIYEFKPFVFTSIVDNL